MDRRLFLYRSLLGGTLASGSALFATASERADESTSPLPPIHSIAPVVGDGKWIWNDPPEETGYLEPREYELEVGINLKGRGRATMLRSTTPVPIEFPEQKIEELQIQKSEGSQSAIRPIGDTSAQLWLSANSIVSGQVISTVAKMRLTLLKQYHGFDKDQFPAKQPKLAKAFRQQYLLDSPGIESRASQVRNLQKTIVGSTQHPWEKAHLFYEWVWENIHARIGNYTSVLRALKSRVGDCEERAACFVAMCRAAGIPARLVWVPNHNWAEFYLVDANQKGHWIPAHTAAYSWFGWTGVHELVIQKGDKLFIPEKSRPQRLLADWTQWQGAKPDISYTAKLTPVSGETSEVGPGARSKNAMGKWVLQGLHPLDATQRDGNS